MLFVCFVSVVACVLYVVLRGQVSEFCMLFWVLRVSCVVLWILICVVVCVVCYVVFCVFM